MNINFALDPTFSAYTVLLIVVGLATLALGFVKQAHQSTGARVLNFVVGAAVLGYGIYLGFIMPPYGTYRIFFYVLILPVVLIINFVKALNARKQQPLPTYTGAPTGAPDAFGQPGGTPYPGAGAPAGQPQAFGQPVPTGQPAPFAQPAADAPQAPGYAPVPAGQPAPQQYGQQPAPAGQPGYGAPQVPGPAGPGSPQQYGPGAAPQYGQAAPQYGQQPSALAPQNPTDPSAR